MVKKDFVIWFAVFYLMTLFPFLSLKYIPFQDLPQHLVAGVAIKDVLFGGELSKNFYIEVFFSNMLAWLIIAFLTIFLDILIASKVLVFLYFLIVPLSLYYYLDEDKKWYSLLSFLFLNNFPLNMGFINFMFSIPMLFFALGAFKKGSRLFYLFSFLLFISHAFTYGLFIVIISGFYMTSKVKDRYKVIFSLVIFCFFIFSFLTKGTSSKIISLVTPSSIVINVIYNLLHSIGIGFQFFRPDYIGLLGFILIMFLYAKQLFWDYSYDKKTLYISLFILILIFFLPYKIPVGKGVWYVFHSRFIPLLTLFTITDLRLGRRLGNILLFLFLFLTLFNSLTLVTPYKVTDERLIDNYEPIINALPSGKRIYLLEDIHAYGLNPFKHYLTGYYSLKGGFSSEYFGGYYTQWPIKYVTNLYYPKCIENITKICVVCEKEGIQCYLKKNATRVESSYMGNETIKCIYCPRPMCIKCYHNETENDSKKKRFIDNKNFKCIRCSHKDIRCFLNNPTIIENFDYLVIFSDNIKDYKIEDLVYISTEDVVVYKV